MRVSLAPSPLLKLFVCLVGQAPARPLTQLRRSAIRPLITSQRRLPRFWIAGAALAGLVTSGAPPVLAASRPPPSSIQHSAITAALPHTPLPATSPAYHAFHRPSMPLSPRYQALERLAAQQTSVQQPEAPAGTCPTGADVWIGGSGDWSNGVNWSQAAKPEGTTYGCITRPVTVTIIGRTNDAGEIPAGLLVGSATTLNFSNAFLMLNGGNVDGTPSAFFGHENLDPASHLFVPSGETLLNGSGSVDCWQNNLIGCPSNPQAISVQGRWTQGTAAVAGTAVRMDNGSILSLSGSGAGAFVASDPGDFGQRFTGGNVELFGNIAPDQSLAIAGVNIGTLTEDAMTVTTGSFTNAGSITLDNSQGLNGSVGLVLPTSASGVAQLTNTGSVSVIGTQFQGTTASSEKVVGSVINKGTITVTNGPPPNPENNFAANLELTGGGTIVNTGTVTVQSGANLTLLGDVFQNTTDPLTLKVGNVANENKLEANGNLGFLAGTGSTFEQDAGTVQNTVLDGPVYLGDTSFLNLQGTGAGAFDVFQNFGPGQGDNVNMAVSGQIAAHQELHIYTEGFQFNGTTTINASGLASNAGTITVQHVGTLPESNLVFEFDTFTNTGSVSDTGAFNRTLARETFQGSRFVNKGSFTADTGPGEGGPANAVLLLGTFVNERTVTVSAGASFKVGSSALFENETGSSITNLNTAPPLGAEPAGFLVGGTFLGLGGTAGSAGAPLVLLSGSKVGGTGAFRADDPVVQSPVYTVAGTLAGSLTVVVEDASQPVTTIFRTSGNFTNAGSILFKHGSHSSGVLVPGRLNVLVPAGDLWTNTGTLTFTGLNETISGNLTNQGGTVNVGTLLPQPSFASVVVAPGETIVNEGGSTTTGVINAPAGSSFTIAGPNTAVTPAIPAAVFQNETGGTVAAGGTPPFSATFLVAGSFIQSGGTVSTASGSAPVQLLNGASLDLAGTGSGAFTVFDFRAPGDNVTVSLTGNLAPGQSLTIYGEQLAAAGTTTVNAPAGFTNAGSITLTHAGGGGGNAVLALPAGGTLTNAGTLTLAGTQFPGAGAETISASVINAGTLRVGTGALASISGALTDQPGSTTTPDVLGAPTSSGAQGTTSNPPPMLTVHGATGLAGALAFVTDPGASLAAGDGFTLLSDASRSGSFASTTGLAAGGGLSYQVTVGSTNIQFCVVRAGPPLISVSLPSPGPANTTRNVTGCGLPASTTLTFKWNCSSSTCAGPIMGALTTTSSGTLSGALTVPPAVTGSYTIAVFTPAHALLQSLPYTVVPSLTFIPNSASAGGAVTVTGDGWTPGHAVSVTWNCNAPGCGGGTVLDSAMTVGANGQLLAAPLTIPSTAPTGFTPVLGLESLGTSVLTAHTGFFVPLPSLMVLPAQGPAPATVHLIGSGFVPHSALTFRFDCNSTSCTGPTIGSTTADADGNLPSGSTPPPGVAVNLPAASVGKHFIAVLNATGHVLATTAYTVQ